MFSDDNSADVDGGDVDVAVSTTTPAAAAAPTAAPAATDLSLLVEQQQQQIQMLTSLMLQMQDKLVQPSAAAAPLSPPPPPAAPASGGKHKSVNSRVARTVARRRLVTEAAENRAAAAAATSAFATTVPSLPDQAPVAPVSRLRVRHMAATSGSTVRTSAEAERTPGAAYFMRRETRSAAGRRIWDYKTNTPRTEAQAGKMTSREEIKLGSTYVARGFSGMV